MAVMPPQDRTKLADKLLETFRDVQGVEDWFLEHGYHADPDLTDAFDRLRDARERLGAALDGVQRAPGSFAYPRSS